MIIIESFDELEKILFLYRKQINADYIGYKNHCIRLLNFLNYLRPIENEDREKLIIATAFHDIGLWTHNTLDYLPPSILEVKKYLTSIGRTEWIEEISIIIDMHHKITPYHGKYKLVELFRKADLVDFSLGSIRYSIPSNYISAVKKTFTNSGFHKMLLIKTLKWVPRHLHRPMPIIKW